MTSTSGRSLVFVPFDWNVRGESEDFRLDRCRGVISGSISIFCVMCHVESLGWGQCVSLGREEYRDNPRESSYTAKKSINYSNCSNAATLLISCRGKVRLRVPILVLRECYARGERWRAAARQNKDGIPRPNVMVATERERERERERR